MAMINEQQAEVVRQLLDENISQREISRMTGIGRDTIRMIFKGKWQVAPPRQPRLAVSARIGRCRECGARVRLPCLACRVRQTAQLTENVA